MGQGELPEAVADVLEHFGQVKVPDDLPPQVEEIYERGRDGKCMMCGGHLGEESLVVINALGTNQLYCSHKCNQDMNVTGWLMQVYDDLQQGVEFRGRGSAEATE